MNIEEITIEQLRFRRIAHSVPCGEHNYHGRMIKDSKLIEEYVTPVGKFLPEEWLETAKRVVEYNGLTALYEKIKQHCQTQCVWLKTEKQIEEYALSCMANHAYNCWKDFMEVTNYKQSSVFLEFYGL